MTRKIIIDCDPGIDDAVAIAMALFDPRLDVLAITAAAGTVEASQATTNVTGIVGQLDPPRYHGLEKRPLPIIPQWEMIMCCTAAMALEDVNSSRQVGSTKPPVKSNL